MAADPLSRDPSSRDLQSRDPQSRDPLSRDALSRDLQSRDPQSRDMQSRDPLSSDPMSRDPKWYNHIRVTKPRKKDEHDRVLDRGGGHHSDHRSSGGPLAGHWPRPERGYASSGEYPSSGGGSDMEASRRWLPKRTTSSVMARGDPQWHGTLQSRPAKALERAYDPAAGPRMYDTTAGPRVFDTSAGPRVYDTAAGPRVYSKKEGQSRG